jgi:hypothetical protein
MQPLTTEDIPRGERLAFVHDFIGRLDLNPRGSQAPS